MRRPARTGPVPDGRSRPAGAPAPAARGAGTGPPRTALVAGASSGIGAAVAEHLAARPGWRLVLTGRDERRLARTAARTGGTALAADLTDAGGCARLVRDATGRAGPVDLLVAGAGIGWAGPFHTMPLRDLERVLDTDLTAVVRLVRLVLPRMVERGSGHIVLIGSIAGAVGVRGEAVYSAAKAGLAAFADGLRHELAGSGVAVSLVVPGAVDTPFFARRGSPYTRSFPRPVPAERVARAVLGAVEDGRREVFVPGWLCLPGRLRGAAPGLFHRLAARFG